MRRAGRVLHPAPWRYNLDYVVDPHGNATRTSTHRRPTTTPSGTAPTANATYTQGGVLTKIEYGLRAGRCTGSTPAGAGQLHHRAPCAPTPPPTWPAPPGAACTVISPTFWNNVRADHDHHPVPRGHDAGERGLVGAGHTLSRPPGTPRRPRRCGCPRSPAPARTARPRSRCRRCASPGTPLPNRVETAADSAAGYSQHHPVPAEQHHQRDRRGHHRRLLPPPTRGRARPGTSRPRTRTRRRATRTTGPRRNRHARYRTGSTSTSVATVTSRDTTGGDPPVVTSYAYSGAAWHYDNDTVSRSATRTWDQWRGFQTVTTKTGTRPRPGDADHRHVPPGHGQDDQRRHRRRSYADHQPRRSGRPTRTSSPGWISSRSPTTARAPASR